jgi:hypothetical protein
MRQAALGVIARSLTVLLLSIAAVSAQSISTAQINGTVKDEGGLVIPGVTITATQAETGLTRTAVTNATGTAVGKKALADLAPRLSVAWDIVGEPATRVRDIPIVRRWELTCSLSCLILPIGQRWESRTSRTTSCRERSTCSC